MSTTMSILGLYSLNKNIFDGLYLPEDVDKDILIDNLLQECSELEILYTEPSFMQFMIEKWSLKMKPTFDKVNEICKAEYNPLYNVDAYETLIESRDLAGTKNISQSGSNTISTSGSDSEDATNTRKVSGFNSNSLVDSEQTINDIDRSNSQTSEGSDSSTSDESSTDTGTITTTNRRYGNIGVTKSTELLRDAMAITPELNIYSFIINSFKDKFCLLIY